MPKPILVTQNYQNKSARRYYGIKVAVLACSSVGKGYLNENRNSGDKINKQNGKESIEFSFSNRIVQFSEKKSIFLLGRGRVQNLGQNEI